MTGDVVDDRHLEMLLRLDERVRVMTEKLDQNHAEDHKERAQVKADLATHVIHSRNTNNTLAEEQQAQRLELMRGLQLLRDEHREEMHEIKKRVEGLEGFRKYALALVGAISAIVTAGIQKVMAHWWS